MRTATTKDYLNNQESYETSLEQIYKLSEGAESIRSFFEEEPALCEKFARLLTCDSIKNPIYDPSMIEKKVSEIKKNLSNAWQESEKEKAELRSHIHKLCEGVAKKVNNFIQDQKLKDKKFQDIAEIDFSRIENESIKQLNQTQAPVLIDEQDSVPIDEKVDQSPKVEIPSSNQSQIKVENPSIKKQDSVPQLQKITQGLKQRIGNSSIVQGASNILKGLVKPKQPTSVTPNQPTQVTPNQPTKVISKELQEQIDRVSKEIDTCFSKGLGSHDVASNLKSSLNEVNSQNSLKAYLVDLQETYTIMRNCINDPFKNSYYDAFLEWIEKFLQEQSGQSQSGQSQSGQLQSVQKTSD